LMLDEYDKHEQLLGFRCKRTLDSDFKRHLKLLFLPINIQPDLSQFMLINCDISFCRCNDNGLP
jgi:hypothetical protein